MNKKEKLLLCEILFILSFTYILDANVAFAIFLALLSFLIVITDLSISSFKKHYLSCLLFSIIFLYLSYIFRIEESVRGFNIIVLLQSCLCSLIEEYSFRELRFMCKINLYLFGTFICLAFVLLDLYDTFFFQRIIMIVLIFCPYFTSILQKIMANISFNLAQKNIRKDR